MNETPFIDVISDICEKDSRYKREAYVFIREALEFTSKKLQKPANGPERHISGQELIEGIRLFAIEEYGPMAATLFKEWGIKKTEDFGELVFALVETGKLGKTDNDKKEDFANGYDFATAFTKPFLPERNISKKKPGITRHSIKSNKSKGK